MSENIVTKSAVSVTEMARMVGLSRARFYQLVKKGTFPSADQDTATSRPCYLEEKQRQILDARRRNCGVDGKPILFYSRRRDFGQTKKVVSRPAKASMENQHADLIDLLAQVKITVTAAQVEAAVKQEFPQGTDGIDSSVVLTALIARFRSQNPPDKQGK
ncbi:MAG: helix-turn-helix transcriptional regulator [Pirellulales bacterium]